MQYFIPWVLFVLAVILAVPITSWLEKRRFQAALARQRAEQLGDVDESLEEEEGDQEEPDEGEFGEAAADDGQPEEQEAVAEENEFGGEDFSAFEEIK